MQWGNEYGPCEAVAANHIGDEDMRYILYIQSGLWHDRRSAVPQKVQEASDKMALSSKKLVSESIRKLGRNLNLLCKKLKEKRHS